MTNHSDHERNLTLSGYAEFTNHSNYEQDQVNLQYSLFISRTLFEGNRITQQIHGNLDAIPENENVDEKNVTERFFGLAGAEVSSYCGDKMNFSEVTMDMETLKVLSVVILVIRQAIMKTPVVLSPAK